MAQDYLKEYGNLFGSAWRRSFTIRNNMGVVKTSSKQLKTDIAKEIETRSGLSNSEARNAATIGLANYDSQKELVSTYIDNNYERVKGIRKSIAKFTKQLKKAELANDYLEVLRLKRKINEKLNKIKSIEAHIERLKQSRDEGKFSVCFGSKKLFGAQFRAYENGYNNRAEWLADWKDARNHIIYYEGSTNYASGNQLVRYDVENKTITITVSPALRHKYGEKVHLFDVNFPRGEEWLTDCVFPVKKTSTRKGKDGQSKETSRSGSAKPVTYRFVMRNGRFYVNATVDRPNKVIETSFVNGALGIDFNPTSIDWTLIDHHSNVKKHGSFKINVQDKRSNQTKDIIGKTVAPIVRIAEQFQVPIVIEELDFEKKKASMKERGVKYARMLSNMVYSQFNQMLEARCTRFGIELTLVNPAYTSVIGVTKYQAMYSLNSGCAAALVIARRGQGRTESLPASHASFFKKPEDFYKPGAWGKVARKINIVGGANRHRWYFGGKKQVRTNCPLYRKLRQTNVVRRDTVQVLCTPHIRKTTALEVSLLLTLCSHA